MLFHPVLAGVIAQLVADARTALARYLYTIYPLPHPSCPPHFVLRCGGVVLLLLLLLLLL
jgi:hypothetical protein